MDDLSYDPDVVVCSKCGSEYQLHVTHCIDCGAPTQSSSILGEPRPGWNRHPLRLPEGQDSVAVRGGTLEWAENFGDFLEENGIPWRLEKEISELPKYRSIRYLVHVRETDLERARELEQEYLLLENPELEAELTELPTTDRCPACDSPVSLDRSECPSCGLSLDGPIVDVVDEGGPALE